MTKLVKLTLKNFKSFKKAEIPISNGFTAIVGSNGSGKSNILDALLFVLGITSLKTLRATKLTDLVNNSVKENYAKVDLLIKNEGKNFEISRMIDKQGKSVYRLDGKRTTLNEINSLLIELGIDILGHNIVTQGDITKIIQMSPFERREIIDNTAGLNEFDEKKEEALKELNKVDSRIKEAIIILNERNHFLEEMEREMVTAKEYASLEQEKKQLKTTILFKEHEHITKKINEHDELIKKSIEEKEKIEEKLSQLNNELTEKKVLSKELNEKILKSNEEIYDIIGKDFEIKKANFILEKEKIEQKNNLIEKNKTKIKQNEYLLNTNKIEKKDIDQKIREITRNINEIQKDLTKNVDVKKEMENIVKHKNETLSKLELDLDTKNKEIDETKKMVFDLEVFVKQWEKQKSFNQKKLNETNNEKQEQEQKLNELLQKEKELKELFTEQIETNIAKLEKKIDELKNNKNVLNAENNQEQKAINELEKEISKCPICESILKKEKKENLLSLKKKSIILNENKIKELIEQIKNEYESLEQFVIKKKKQDLLTIETKNINENKNKLIELSEKIKNIEKELNQKDFETQINKRNKLNQQITLLLNEKEQVNEKIRIIRTENIFEKYSETIKTQDLLNQKKSELENNKTQHGFDLNKILAREESILIENEELSKEIKEIVEENNKNKPLLEQIELEIIQKEKEMQNAKKNNEAVIINKKKIDERIEKIEKELNTEAIKSKRIEVDLNNLRIENSKLEVKQKDLEEETKDYMTVEKIFNKTIEEMKERMQVINKKLEEIGMVNMKAMENFEELKKEVDEMQDKTNKLEIERLSVLDMIDKIDVKRTDVFMECFNEINKNFQEMFSKFFSGEGILNLTNPENPLESGLIIDAKTKNVKLQNIDSMSGGEKTLTALAFMFAIQLYAPAPFYAFDEADASLDKENSTKMGSLIEMIAKNSQFIAITHNDAITKKAAQIVGVAINKDNSSVIGLRLKNN